MSTERPRVVVFGSGSVAPQSTWYRRGEELGRQLAVAGFSVATGGYYGLMEAVSKGAREAGGEVVAVTVARFGELAPNDYLTLEVRHADLLGRIAYLMQAAAAYVVLAGGIGTLAELFVAWNLLKTRHWDGEPPPLLVWRDPWEPLLVELSRSPGFEAHDFEMLRMVDSVAEVVAQVEKHLARDSGESGAPDALT